MFDVSRLLGLAALFVLASAILHILIPFFAGFATGSLPFLAIGVAYAVIAYGLTRNTRWLAWLTFFVMLAGGIAALVLSMGVTAAPSWLYTLIMLADWAAALMLFVYLWYPKASAV